MLHVLPKMLKYFIAGCGSISYKMLWTFTLLNNVFCFWNLHERYGTCTMF